MASHKCKEVKPTYDEQYAIDVSTVAFMNVTPFYAHVFYSVGRLVVTRDVPTAATDGRHIMVNPDYFCKLKVPERVFVLAHEMSHLVGRHAQRFKHYEKQGDLRGKPWVHEHANTCADYVINADLVDTICSGQGASCNPAWLYDPNIKGSELWEDVYERTLKVIPPPPGGGQGKPGDDDGSGGSGQQGTPTGVPQGGNGGQSPPSKYDTRAPKGSRVDKVAEAQGGSFDQLLDPPIDAATQAPDLPDEAEFTEAVVRAAAAAKAMGKLPASIERMVADLLAPKVDWREHIRLLVTGKIGSRSEAWERPNRRRLALNPLVIMPGKRGYGADCVVVAVDTSGSIGQAELDVFFAEVGGILNDCKPRKIIVLGCDAAIQQEDEVSSLDEFEGLRVKGIKGGGGTSFVPVFELLAERDIRPDTLVYLTDMMGSFPNDAPAYPVIWAATTDLPAPFGEIVRID